MAKKAAWFPEIMKELKAGKYRPVYFLAGEEPFFIDQVADYIEKNALSEEEKSFNQQVLYGKETDASTIVSEAMRYPMMAERVVVIVKEAQTLRDLDPFDAYIKNPSPSTVLVICHKYKKVDKRKTLGKNLGKSGALFESEKLYDSDIPAWINHWAASQGYRLDPRASMLLFEFIGNDLTRLANELKRLTVNLQPGAEITPQIVSEFTGISREYNNFELVTALANRNVQKANQIIQYFGRNPKDNPMVVTLSILYGLYSKMLIWHTEKGNSQKNELASKMGVNPFFMKDYEAAGRHYDIRKIVQAVSILREYDLKSKGVGNAGTPQGELLKEMIFKLTH